MDTIYKRSAGGIVFSEGKILTIKVGPPYNEIVFPKGTIEEGETEEQTAVREIAEETGYDTHVITPIDTFSYEFDENGNHYHKELSYFILALNDKSQEASPNREQHEEDEGFENLWLTIDDARKLLTHQNNKEMLEKAVSIIKSSDINL